MPADLPVASERLRERAAAELAARLPEHLGRLGWDRARLAAHQRDRLRELLACAAANSRFHAQRLAGIDLDQFEVADLPRLPVMTKGQMMSHFDDLVTDRRLSLRRVQAHLDASKTRASLLLDEFVCLASGGSSGLRGVFVQTAAAYMDFMASFIGPAVARGGLAGTRPGGLIAATEGLAGHSDPGGRVLTFATDICIVELVAAGNRPVPPGTAAAKVLVTNLHNLTQPLIRYELTDRFVRQPDDPGGRLRATVDGRADSVFRYGDVAVHPIIFYSVLEGVPAITEFQVRQMRQGVTVDVVADGHLDKPALRDALRRGLTRSGLTKPEVTINAVTSIERHAETGKVLRFLPYQA